MRDLAELALDAARAAGAGYTDVRVSRYRRESMIARDDRARSPERSESSGIGVRCLIDGAWGFAASHRRDRDEIARVARLAAGMARANQGISRSVALAPSTPRLDAWQTPLTKDPLKISIGRKIDLLLAINRSSLAVQGASAVTSFLHTLSEDRYLATSEGGRVDQQITRIWPGCTVIARAGAGGDFATRDVEVPAAQRGYEYLEEADLPSLAARAAGEAVLKLRAPRVEAGVKDLVIHPSNLWLALHETVAHPLDLDRAYGYEGEGAGRSFVLSAAIGSLRYGSDRMNVTADRTLPGGLATSGYDDEGVRASEWPLIRSGVLVDFPTNREQAAWIGRSESRGCAHADSWGSFPLQRMPNISLEPAEGTVGVEELIADVKDGLYVEGRGEWSVDPERSSFRLSGGWVRTIKSGRIGPPVRGAAYQARTLAFWSALDLLGGERTWEVGGTLYDSKGEPAQVNAVSHGCPAARFRGIQVVDAGGGSH